MNGFQTRVNTQPAPGVAGDFASANMNKYSVLAGPGGIVAGAAGLYQARFAWLDWSRVDGDSAPALANNTGSGAPAGFVRRDQQALNTTYLSSASMLMPQGFPVTLFSEGDFWVVNDGAALAQPGMKAYANFADGKVTFAASGAASTAVVTGTVAASTFSATGSIAGNILTVSAVASGPIVAGATVSGTGVAAGTKIVSQLTGTAGGVGTYAVNIAEQTVASTSLSGTYGTLTVSAVTSGVLGVGDVLTAGAGAVVGTVLTQFLTGTGGVGTYVVDNNTAVTSATTSIALTFATNVETKWYCRSTGLPGEVVKMSSIS